MLDPYAPIVNVRPAATWARTRNAPLNPPIQSASAYVAERLIALEKQIADRYHTGIGFPGSVDFEYGELYRFFGFLLNNVGDPYQDPVNANHSKEMEREVVDFFADLFRAPAADRWGYVTNGGTEGNLYGLYLGRELYPDAHAYFSEASHYSVRKNTDMLRVPTTAIRAMRTGEMDYDDLYHQVASRTDKPAIVVANVGTTMTEARDNVAAIRQVLDDLNTTGYLHVDAALSGIYTAFSEPHWPFDFADGADSISISGHKFIGSPMPCGVVLTRGRSREQLTQSINYTGSVDSTISGSRNGHTPIFMWYAIQRWGVAGFRRRAAESAALAEYTEDLLNSLGWPTWRNPGAITVMLAEPPGTIVRKWQLATFDGWSHIICMPGVLQAQIDAFVADLAGHLARNGNSP